MKMNLPNKLTIFRILMIPVFIVLFFVEFEGHTLAAALVYVVACFTDFFDGYIARKQNLVTNFGKFVDPIADKMIIACSLIAICVTEPIIAPAHVYKILVAVFTMLILSRELMISVFRTVAADKGVVLAADMIGKFKTLVQMMALFALLPVADFVVWNELAGIVFYYGGFILLSIATLLTVISGVHYIVKNRSVLEG
ncbi:CDP-diacylglycerol--glycerol-3-phosphate 3-phosphatidyltransferase [Anaerocaecibacter muris]|uniref:CDP-diacylglycerol--glycerol-3-phosphate 3-phosphatidyltransferase n=1 Tax=Anaerocaecibacter muris TaxID=2941513 RepID=UPI003F68D411